AAILIQNWYRRYLAREEVRRRCSWTIFTSLEYAGEQDQTKLYNFFTDLILHLIKFNPEVAATIAFPNPCAFAENSIRFSQTAEDRLMKLTDPKTVRLEPEYKGLRIKLPLTGEIVVKLIDYFKRGKLLHARYVLTIIHEARRILKYKPNINYASSVHTDHITICGDLHGKIEDLLTVFYKNGLPLSFHPIRV
ncbi:hypothetical protein CEXT_662471, partial [Caerostris extrusa]